MTDNLRDRISVTQQAHIFCITECSCGHRFPWEKSTEWRERAEWAWARHVADAVIEALPDYLWRCPKCNKGYWADHGPVCNVTPPPWGSGR